jgi:hypothetical protein
VTFEDRCQAPEGQVWVCGACGRYSKNSLDIGDESCFLNAVLCYEEKVDENFRAVPNAPISCFPDSDEPTAKKFLDADALSCYTRSRVGNTNGRPLRTTKSTGPAVFSALPQATEHHQPPNHAGIASIQEIYAED